MQEVIWNGKNLINIGVFVANNFNEGIQIHKNEAIYVGKTRK